MDELNDGGPAFPRTAMADGMSLRDWFAGQVIGAIYADDLVDVGDMEPMKIADMAHEAYRVADAMLAERSKP